MAIQEHTPPFTYEEYIRKQREELYEFKDMYMNAWHSSSSTSTKPLYCRTLTYEDIEKATGIIREKEEEEKPEVFMFDPKELVNG